MTEKPEEHAVLHALRLKGVAALESLLIFDAPEEEIQDLLAALTRQGLVIFRESSRIAGWTLTEAGRQRHKEELTRSRSQELVVALSHPYEEFLTLNPTFKDLCAHWQALHAEDLQARRAAIDALGLLHQDVENTLDRAGMIVGRFIRYREDLRNALERLHSGDHRFFTSINVQSYHNVWFECHEDFLLTLGRDRSEE